MAAKKKSAPAKSAAAKKPAAKKAPPAKPLRREIGAAVCIILAFLVALACFGVDAFLINAFRKLGKGLIGKGIYILPLSLLGAGIVLMFHKNRPIKARVWSAVMTAPIMGALIQVLSKAPKYVWSWSMVSQLYHDGISGVSGGAVSGFVSYALSFLISPIGAGAVFAVLLLLCLFIALDLSLEAIAERMRNRPDYPEPEPKEPRPVKVRETRPEKADPARKRAEPVIDIALDEPSKKVRKTKFDIPLDEPVSAVKAESDTVKSEEEEDIPFELPPLEKHENAAPPVMTPQEKAAQAAEIKQISAEVAQHIEKELVQQPVYKFPPIDLLKSPAARAAGFENEIALTKQRLAEDFENFNVAAVVRGHTRGPSVTRYEVELSLGTKLSKLTNLADDIALTLGSSSVRIAPIPGQISMVGIEVPNQSVNSVNIRSVIQSSNFKNSRSKVSFAVGEDISGQSVVCDISKLPHLLIAGTTGSGKSVCMNSIIVSLLYKATPEDVRLIMIDPKMIELGIYNGIPHLLIPVVTDPKKAAGALQWAVTEMMKRYRLFAELNVRDIASYNEAVKKHPDRDKLPQIVIIIDELADLMMVAKKEVEESICRIAQMARAAGMHLVIATQRPSADVITGLMKANIPSRISFAVASAMESRIILDAHGAESLVGKGDMLYAPLGGGEPQRVQGCFITSEEVEAVAEFVKSGETVEYSDEVMRQVEANAKKSGTEKVSVSSASDDMDEDDEADELLPDAVEVILECGQASVSMLQRRLKLGYSRAARLVDQMEQRGYVGPFEGSKPRAMLVTKEQWALSGLASEKFMTTWQQTGAQAEE
ncbi:MAG: DNA translocase FtsK [Oscillospiraceae bacterium]|nr:DNA translocase FtsK [Oscillospiraceae bacterium]